MTGRESKKRRQKVDSYSIPKPFFFFFFSYDWLILVKSCSSASVGRNFRLHVYIYLCSSDFITLHLFNTLTGLTSSLTTADGISSFCTFRYNRIQQLNPDRPPPLQQYSLSNNVKLPLLLLRNVVTLDSQRF